MQRLQWKVFATVLVLGIAPICDADEHPSLEKLGPTGNIRSIIESELADNISPSEPKGTVFHVRTFHLMVMPRPQRIVTPLARGHISHGEMAA